MTFPRIGEIVPDFSAQSTIGNISFHEWLGDSWGLLLSFPSSFTPVSTSELSRISDLANEFHRKNVKVVTLSCKKIYSWMEDVRNYSKSKNEFPFPIVEDESRDVTILYNMFDPTEKDDDGLPLACRAIFVVDPKKYLRLTSYYPAAVGRNFNEILRAIESLQLTHMYQVATPADWTMGDEVMILPSVGNEEAKTLFPGGISYVNLPSGKEYLRKVHLVLQQ